MGNLAETLARCKTSREVSIVVGHALTHFLSLNRRPGVWSVKQTAIEIAAEFGPLQPGQLNGLIRHLAFIAKTLDGYSPIVGKGPKQLMRFGPRKGEMFDTRVFKSAEMCQHIDEAAP